MEEKRGQVTIFVIIAILIVILAGVLYYFYPQIEENFSGETENPNQYIQQCIQEDFEKNVKKITSQGGSLEPEHYILHNNDKIEYLCYASEDYQNCVVQRPLLKEYIEKEALDSIEEKTNDCFNEMVNNFESRGYDVDLRKKGVGVNIVPEGTVLDINHTLELEKKDTRNYDGFSVVLNNNLYELVYIAKGIIEWETIYGDAETTVFMGYHRDVKVEKKKQSDGSTVYILTDRDTEDKLQFASRSIPWPAGY